MPPLAPCAAALSSTTTEPMDKGYRAMALVSCEHPEGAGMAPTRTGDGPIVAARWSATGRVTGRRHRAGVAGGGQGMLGVALHRQRPHQRVLPRPLPSPSLADLAAAAGLIAP